MRDGYKVGYMKPPSHTRFKKGQSGNPKGRPRGTKNIKTDLQEEVEEQVIVREGSSERRISKQRAVVKTQFAKAIKGDDRAARTVLDMICRVLGVGDEEGHDTSLSEDDRAIIKGFEARILKGARPQGGHKDEARNPKP